jgi:hypothetical protein
MDDELSLVTQLLFVSVSLFLVFKPSETIAGASCQSL